jgi:hypothetical protein
MKIVLCLLIVFLLTTSISVGAQSGIRLEINSRLPAKYAKKPRGLTLTAASQLFPYVEESIKEVEYLIAFDQDTRKIKYIYTDDKDFKSSNGTKVGQEITLKWDDIDVLAYFQLRGPADKDGWQPVVAGTSAFEGDFLERVRNAGKLITEIDGFAKGYNY